MSAVTTFKLVHGEWLFERILDYLNLTEEEFREKYESELEKDCTCLNDVIGDMIYQNIKRKRSVSRC